MILNCGAGAIKSGGSWDEGGGEAWSKGSPPSEPAQRPALTPPGQPAQRSARTPLVNSHAFSDGTCRGEAGLVAARKRPWFE
jgi:hypothetical protein